MKTIYTACAAVSVGSYAVVGQERWIIDVSNVVSPTAPSAVITMTAEFDPADHAFAAALFSFVASEPGW